MARSGGRSAASWVFGFLLLAFLIWVFVFAPDTLPAYKQRMLGLFLASLAGLFAFFLTGDIGLDIQSMQSRFGTLGVKATGGIGVFVLVLVWWWSPLSPIGVEKIEKKVSEIQQDTEMIRQDTGKIVVLLQGELSVKNTQLIFLQGQVERLQAQAPSPRARALAAQIPLDADAYALALKAIAESRFADARVLLGEAQQAKEVELVRIYQARGETETYAGRYGDAVGWYEKALALNPNDPTLVNATALALLHAGQYAQAEPLFTRALAVREQALGPEHPDVAQSLNNLAWLYYSQGEYAKAEPLYQRALAMREQALGPEHPDVALTLNGYGVLLQKMGRGAEAAEMEARAKTILERGHRKARAQ